MAEYGMDEVFFGTTRVGLMPVPGMHITMQIILFVIRWREGEVSSYIHSDWCVCSREDKDRLAKTLGRKSKQVLILSYIFEIEVEFHVLIVLVFSDDLVIRRRHKTSSSLLFLPWRSSANLTLPIVNLANCILVSLKVNFDFPLCRPPFLQNPVIKVLCSVSTVVLLNNVMIRCDRYEMIVPKWELVFLRSLWNKMCGRRLQVGCALVLWKLEHNGIAWKAVATTVMVLLSAKTRVRHNFTLGT